MLQALLLAIWAGLCTWDQFGPHLGFRKPPAGIRRRRHHPR